MDDRDFNHILRETFECGLPFRLYIKREMIHPRAAHRLSRRGIVFFYSSYAVCAEHFASLPENEERQGVYFSGELAKPYHTDRKRLLSALMELPGLKPYLHIPLERQSVEHYFDGLRSSLVGLDLPAGGKITPRRYEVPACGAVLLTTNRVDWLTDDPLQAGVAAYAPPNEEGICMRLQELLADPPACRRLGDAGRRFVLEHHTTTRRAEALCSVLENCFHLRMM
jgi:hypothetical protein